MTPAAPARLLLIHPDPELRFRWYACLVEAGYTVNMAEEGSAGLGHLEENAVAVLLTAVVMPGTDGLIVIDTVRLLYPHVRIVAVASESRLDAAQYLSTAKLLGAHGTLRRLDDPARLLEIVSEQVEQSCPEVRPFDASF